MILVIQAGPLAASSWRDESQGPEDRKTMVNRNLLRQYDLPEDELHQEFEDTFPNGVEDWLPAEGQLRILDVRGNALSRNAVEALARSPFLVQLDELHADPGDNSPEEIGWPFLVERFGARLR